MDCLVTGCNFLLRCISDESFIYQKNPKSGQSQYKFLPSNPDIFPYMVVNIGSGVSILKVWHTFYCHPKMCLKFCWAGKQHPSAEIVADPVLHCCG